MPAIAGILNAKVSKIDDVVSCGPGDPSRGIPPWATCQIFGAASFVGMSDSRISGTEGQVTVVVWSESDNVTNPSP
jgi:hypothetical protein